MRKDDSKHKLTREEFYDYMEDKIKPWNAKLAFHCGLFSEMYQGDKITLNEAVKEMWPMRLYDGTGK